MLIFENNIKVITINKIWIALAYTSTAIYKKESCVLHRGASLSGKSHLRDHKVFHNVPFDDLLYFHYFRQQTTIL